ncbi:MAG: hypothetical protein R2867_42525 [Caldilineaceae bacterium]
MIFWLTPEQYVSGTTARLMAGRAYTRARQLTGNATANLWCSVVQPPALQRTGAAR